MLLQFLSNYLSVPLWEVGASLHASEIKSIDSEVIREFVAVRHNHYRFPWYKEIIDFRF